MHPFGDDALNQHSGGDIKGGVPHPDLGSDALALEVRDLWVGGESSEWNTWCGKKHMRMTWQGGGQGGAVHRGGLQPRGASSWCTPAECDYMPREGDSSSGRSSSSRHMLGRPRCFAHLLRRPLLNRNQGAIVQLQGTASIAAMRGRKRDGSSAPPHSQARVWRGGKGTQPLMPAAGKPAGASTQAPPGLTGFQARPARPGHPPWLTCGSMVVVGAATKKGMSWWCAATAWQNVPILLAAAGRVAAGEGRGSAAGAAPMQARAGRSGAASCRPEAAPRWRTALL